MNVYLIRHMATADNEAGVWMGRGLDLPVLESQKQAFSERVGRLFEGGLEGKSAVYCSPLQRAKETAEELAKTLNLDLEPVVIADLTEDQVGEWEGKSIAQTRQDFPQEFETWQKNADDFRFPGGESFQEIQERSYSKILEISKKEMGYGASNLFIVTHGDPIRTTVSKIMEAPINAKNEFTVDNGSVTSLVFDGEKFVVKELNYL